MWICIKWKLMSLVLWISSLPLAMKTSVCRVEKFYLENPGVLFGWMVNLKILNRLKISSLKGIMTDLYF